MGVVDKPIRLLSSHPHLPKLKEVPTVLPQFSGVPVHLPPFRPSLAPQIFIMIVKEVKQMTLTRGVRLHQYLDDQLIGAPSQEEAQVKTQNMVYLTQSLVEVVSLVLKRFKDQCQNRTVSVAMDSSTVVAYIKQTVRNRLS